MHAPSVRSIDLPWLALRVMLLIFSASVLGSLTTPQAVPQDIREPGPDCPPTVVTATRLIPLYYTRDAGKVIGLVRGSAQPQSAVLASPQADRLQLLAEERQRLQSQHAALLEQRNPPARGLLEATNVLPTPRPSTDQNRAKIEHDLRQLEGQEQALRASVFREESQRTASGAPLVAEASESPDAADRVRIAVAGEGQMYLLGPLEGVNAITRMVHEIDQPVGQVKIGIHVIQFTATEDEAFECVHGAIDRNLGHARQMSQTSQVLFRAALSNVAARYYASDPNRFEETFFYGPCVRHFRSLNGGHVPLSISLLDSRDIVTTLYLASLATNQTRREILTEFRRLAGTELPRLHEQHQQATASVRGSQARDPSLFARLTRTADRRNTDEQPDMRPPDVRFTHTTSCLESFGDQPNSANAIQVATTRFQRATLELRRAEAAVAAMRNDRRLLAFTAPNQSPSAHIQNISSELLDANSFGRLADHVIEEQAARVLDLREVVRAEAAALDGQLKRLTAAFEEDIRQQFYKPALEDLRRDSGARSARMGQIQTTTIRTNDRTPARVSPGQVAVLDRPARPVLLQEGLQVAHGLAQEAGTLAQIASLQTMSDTVAPGSSAWLAQTGLAPIPGQHLGELVGASERTTVSVGDDIVVTPVVQPDGSSVAFHLIYTHTPQRTSDAQTPISSGVQRHLVEADVQVSSLELQEVSRFRVTLEAVEQGRGIPLLEDVPLAGALFRPRRSAVATVQENIILVEAVVYPTAMALAGKGWLALESAETGIAAVPDPGSSTAHTEQGELTTWVLQTLRRQAQANLAEASSAQRIARPPGGPFTASAGRPFPR